jgi:uncharacterized protein (TIGR02118 family)
MHWTHASVERKLSRESNQQRGRTMPIKAIVLYPPPDDPQLFERRYHGEHMPLMRSLIEPESRIPTFRIRGPQGAPFYRMAEVHFASLEELNAFARSEAGQDARRSSERVSSGGKPIVLVCEPDAHSETSKTRC